MSKKFQRFLSLVTALIMALYSVPVSAFASETVDVQVVSEEVHTCEFALISENAPTCTEAGSKTYACSCGNGYSEEISAIGHSYSSAVTTEATCAQVGVITYTCSACNDSYTEEIPMIDHSHETVTVEATCTEAGKITSTCTVCGAVTEEEIPALEHNFEEDLENSIEATCTEEGSLVKVCTLCGEIETEVVEMAEHEYVDGICSVCGAIDLAVAVKAGPAGTLSSSLVDLSDPAKIFISAEITGLNATESVVIKLYDANGVHLATTTLLKPEYYTASLLGVNIIITGDSSSWSTVWEADKLRADYVPAYAELYVDGVFMNQANVPMVSTNGEAAVNWAEVPGVPAAPLADPVAMIGDQGYASLQEALDAAKGESNIVINLMKDATLDVAAWQTLAIGGDATETITINGNEHKLTFNQLDSDWDNVATNNAKLILNNMTIANSGYNGGPWNRYDINFACDVELNNVTSERALAFKAGATLKNVVINESEDVYAIWIQPNGQNVTIDGLTINSAGRGIKIDDQYVDNPGKVDLTVKDATFSTAKKAAIMVKSTAGANISVDNVDISNVKADSTNVVWNDEDAVADYGEITVTGGTLGQEGNFPAVLKDANGNVKGFYKTLPEAVTAAQSGDIVTITTDGTYTLNGFSKELTIKAEEGVEAVVDNNGAVALSDAKVTFENLIFDYYPNDNYVGLQHIDTAIYNNCTFNGQVFLYGNYEEFNNCTFNQESSDAYNVWTYGAKEVEFNECTFNSAGKAVLVYNEGATANHVVFNNSELIATSPVEGKAAVEIDTSLMPAGTEIEINNTTATNFAAGSVSGNSLWNDKKDQENLSVSVDSEEVWPVFVAKIGDKGYTSLQAALADAQPGDTVVLLESITADTAVDGTDVTIDLNSNTLTLTVGDNNFFGTSTIKNGTIDITGCIAEGDDCIIGIGDYSNDATLTLDDVNICGDGYSSAYAVLYVYNAGTLNINGGSVVVSNDNSAAGGVIKAHSAANGKINIVGTESDPVELTFNNAKIGMLDGTVLMEYVDLDITGGANAINQSALTVKNSSLTIKDCDGRALTLNDGDVTIENSTLDFSGATEGEIRYKKALTLKLVGDTDITGCDIWSDVAGAKVIDADGTEFTVSGTETEPNIVKAEDGQVELKEKPKGTITYGYTSQIAVWGEGGGNAKESLDVELYVGDTKIATASLNNIGGIIDGDVYVTWSIPFAGSTDEYWTVEWAESYPSADAQPTKVVMIIDGEKVAENDVVMNAPDNLNPVVWKDLLYFNPIEVTYPVGNPVYPEGKVEYYSSILEAVPYTTNCPRLEGATVKLLRDIEGPGIRMMENDMVLDLNDFTYTITAGTGSQGTNTSGFQIRQEITTKATIKNGTINVAEGVPVVWMFNVYASDFVVEDVTVDCANMAYSYGESCYVSLSRAGDNVQFTGNTTIVNFNAGVAGNAINVGDTMTIADTVKVGGTIELDAGAKLTACEGLDVVAADEGYVVDYSNGVYTVFLPTVTITDAEGNVTYYATLQAALDAAEGETDIVIDLLADATLDITAWDTLAIGGETTETITINGNGNKLTFNQLDSDWNNVATNNNAKLILNDMTIANSGYNNGPWNRYDINFGCDVELNNVTSEKALAFKAGAVLKDVIINESGDNYAIWIQANGQTVSIDGLDVTSAGRGIKIDEQYVDAAKVDLTVKNANFDTQKKGAIMVKSAAGADITLENVDISKAAADTVNAVWNDEDAAAYFGKVSVTGGTLVQEGDFVATLSDADGKIQGYYKTLQAALDAAEGETDIVIELLADATLDITAWDTLAIGGETTETITINGNRNKLTFNQLDSDWNNVATNNNAKLILNDMTIANSGYNNGPWNRYDINFGCDVEMKNVISDRALAFKAGAVLKDVIINESGDNYAIWIQANGQTVSIDGLDVTSAGRGIKIDEQYVDAAKVDLTVKDATFVTQKKGAIMVKSAAGADITLENVDISKAVADTVNAVWNDEDAAAYFGKVSVTGGTLVQEGDFVATLSDADGKIQGYYKTLQAALDAAEAGDTITLLQTIVLEEDKEVDLKGLTVDCVEDVYPAFRIQNEANVTFQNGTVTNSDYVFVLGASDGSSAGNLTIKDGNYKGETTVASVTKGTLTIEGGEFAVEPYEGNYNYLLNCIDKNYKDGTAKIEVKGGTFNNFDPANNAAEGEGTDFVAEGYVSVDNGDGTWTVVEDKLFDIVSSNIVLGNELAMYFYVMKSDLEGEDYVAVVTKTYADGRSDLVVQIPYEDWENTTNERMRFRFDGIAAKEMGDNINVVIKVASTMEDASNPYNDCIKTYVERGFSSGKVTNKELGTLLVDMLNYGAAAQRMFNYNVTELANSNMDAYQEEYATKSVTCTNNQVKGDGYRSATLTLESRIIFTMLFNKTHVTQDMTAVVTFTDHYGASHELKISGADFEDRGAAWGIEISEYVVADACQILTCTFLDANGNIVEGVSGQDSIESLCARAIAGGGGDYYEYIMKFTNAAYNYFH